MSRRQLLEEHPDRLITVSRTDADTSTPLQPTGERLDHLDLQTDESKRWRGTVGTMVAHLCGWETSGKKTWHIEAWPDGYSLWRKTRSDGRTNDIHLYGKHHWTSPIECALHILFLFSDEEHDREDGCRCNRCTKRSQGKVNEVEFGRMPRAKSRRPSSHERTQTTGSRETSSRGVKEDSHDLEDTLKGITDLRARRSNLKCLEREKDLESGQRFKKGELVWAWVPAIKPSSADPTKENDVWFWPGLIQSHRMDSNISKKLRAVHYSRRKDSGRVDNYRILLFGTNEVPVIEENQLLPWYSHAYPTDIWDLIANAYPKFPISHKFKEFRAFPLLRPPPEHAWPRTLEFGAAPLALAMKMVGGIGSGFMLTNRVRNMHVFRDGTVEGRWQGCWLGAERVWYGEFVRVAGTIDELRDICNFDGPLEITAEMSSRGLLLYVRHFVSNDAGEFFVVGPLLGLSSLTDRPGIFQLSGRHPNPPKGFAFQRITDAGQFIRLPVDRISGKYNYLDSDLHLLSSLADKPSFMSADDRAKSMKTRLDEVCSLLPSPTPSETWVKGDFSGREDMIERHKVQAMKTCFRTWSNHSEPSL